MPPGPKPLIPMDPAQDQEPEGTPAHLLLGRRGEDAAEEFLLARGFAILERNWRFRQWEIDFICEQDGTLVFVEVKTRGPGSLGTPEDGLTAGKRKRLVRAASEYLSRKKAWERPCRFDLVTVTERQGALWVEHHENAFDLQTLRGGHAHWQPW